MIIGIPFFERKKSGEVIYELSVIYNVEENIKKTDRAIKVTPGFDREMGS